MKHRAKLFLSLLGLILFIYLLFRLFFLFRYFRSDSIAGLDFLKIFYWGFRLDLFSVLLVNIPVWVFLFFLSDLIKDKTLNRKILLFLILLLNIPFIILNIIDLAYFNFNLRRSTVDLFAVLKDSKQAWGIFFLGYWYLVLFGVFIIAILVFCSKKILKTYPKSTPERATFSTAARWLVWGTLLVLLFWLARGFGPQPVTPSTPLLHLAPAYQPLVENSTITFLYSVFRTQTSLPKKNYYSPSVLDSLFTIRHQYASPDSFQKRNVVIFVLESFSKNLVQNGSRLKARTPFLDSLMQQSLVCEEALANGLESNKGLVALLAGIPPLL